MSNFEGELITSYDHRASKILGGDFYRVRRSYRFYIPTAYLPINCTVTNRNCWAFVPAGMLTDLGTIPALLRGGINPAGAAAQAFVLHDQLCEYLSVTNNGLPQKITRQEADLILRAAMLDLEIDRTQCQLIYNAVAAYSEVMHIRDPSTTAIKRRLEAEYNYEAFL